MCMWYVCVLGSVCACGSQKLTLGTFLNCFLSYILRQSLPLNLELMSGSIWDLPVSGHAPRPGVMAHGIYTGIGDPSSSLPFKQQALQPLNFSQATNLHSFYFIFVAKATKAEHCKTFTPTCSISALQGTANLPESQTLTTCKKSCLYVWTWG